MSRNNKKYSLSLARSGLFAVAITPKITNPMYMENVYLSNFSNLISIESVKNVKNEMYLVYDTDLINNFSDMNPEEKSTFENALSHLKFCAARGETGIKKLKGTLKLSQEGPAITHEIKISKKGRILLTTLAPITSGPTLLVASHYVKKGLHDNNTSKTPYKPLKLDISKKTMKPH